MPDYTRRTVGKRAERVPQFAAYLRQRRGKRSRPEVVARMRRAGYAIDQSALSKYEDEARVPNVGVLAALAVAYRTPFESLCARLAAELTSRPAPPAPEELSDDERDVVQIHRDLKGSSARDPWVAVGRGLVPLQAREEDVVG